MTIQTDDDFLLSKIFNFSDNYFLKPRPPRNKTLILQLSSYENRPSMRNRVSKKALLKETEKLICELAMVRDGDNSIKRHLECRQASDLSLIAIEYGKTRNDRHIVDLRELTKNGQKVCPWRCYPCGKETYILHDMYVFSCPQCGDKFEGYRYQSRDLSGQVALVTGARSKLGYQVALKLLRAKCMVIVCTRQPKRALYLYEDEPDYETWKSRLHVYPVGLDFLSATLESDLDALYRFIDRKFDKLDILVNNAAQTIKEMCSNKQKINGSRNRYGDPASCPEQVQNSWTIPLEDVSLEEFTEVFRVNSIAPAMLFSRLKPLLHKSPEPYLINVHAREGIFNVRKSACHVHTNMAKAALAMMTNCAAKNERRIRVHGVDPGWISQDEYYTHAKPWLVAPLDEVDGAARILFPVFERLKSCPNTRRHFDQMLI